MAALTPSFQPVVFDDDMSMKGSDNFLDFIELSISVNDITVRRSKIGISAFLYENQSLGLQGFHSSTWG
ncbi:MAG: hypothetical protein ACP5MG_10495 [Verrucomicrobiia bacterium]